MPTNLFGNNNFSNTSPAHFFDTFGKKSSSNQQQPEQQQQQQQQPMQFNFGSIGQMTNQLSEMLSSTLTNNNQSPVHSISATPPAPETVDSQDAQIAPFEIPFTDPLKPIQSSAVSATPPIMSVMQPTLLDMPAAIPFTQSAIPFAQLIPASNGFPSAQDARLEEELNVERHRNHELSVQLLNKSSHIEELKNEIQRLRIENSTKVTMEIGPLQEQLNAHVQTIGVLVGDKAELIASLNKFQGLAKEKINEVEELQGRLSASRHRVQLLEKDIGSIKSSHDKYDSSQQRLCTELEGAQEELRTLKKQIDDTVDERAELKQKLSIKSKEIDRLDAELTATKSDLNISQLRVEQFSAGDVIESDTKIETLSQQKNFFEQQVHELQKMVQQIGSDRDQASQQYQNYVQQLTKESATLAQKIQEYAVDNERLAKREDSLVKHVGDLERQIQQQIAKQKNYKDIQKEEILRTEGKSNDEQLPELAVKCEQLELTKTQLEVHSL